MLAASGAHTLEGERLQRCVVVERRRQRNGALVLDAVVCTTHHAVVTARTRARRSEHTTNLTTSRSRRFARLRANMIRLIGCITLIMHSLERLRKSISV